MLKRGGQEELRLNDRAFRLRRRWSCGCAMWLGQNHERLYLACNSAHSEETVSRIARELALGKAIETRAGFHKTK